MNKAAAKTKKAPKYVSFLWLVCILLFILIGYFFVSNKINTRLVALIRQESEYRTRILELEKEKKDLEESILLSQTDAFIENEARTKYGYLKPGEIRFEILNPDALYEDYGFAQNDTDQSSSNGQFASGEIG